MNIHVHIERVVLDGLPLAAAQANAVRATLETELGHLLAADGLAPGLLSGASVAHLRTADLRLDSRPDPAGIGTQIAGVVYGGMSA
ncbi:MAG: hypothetical protein ACRD0K_00390 [Egibacteraceae bacterium]